VLFLGWVSNRTLLPLVVIAIAWGCLLQWPWGQTLVPALIALGVAHLLYPLIATSRSMPLVVAAVDAVFLVVAWRSDTWGDLTPVFVPVLAGIALVALLYASTVVLVLHWRRTPPADKPS
jgi:hypothetical protein